mgnify:CR=1 FL=1
MSRIPRGILVAKVVSVVFPELDRFAERRPRWRLAWCVFPWSVDCTRWAIFLLVMLFLQDEGKMLQTRDQDSWLVLV